MFTMFCPQHLDYCESSQGNKVSWPSPGTCVKEKLKADMLFSLSVTSFPLVAIGGRLFHPGDFLLEIGDRLSNPPC